MPLSTIMPTDDGGSLVGGGVVDQRWSREREMVGPDAGTDGGICAPAADLGGDDDVVVVIKDELVEDELADGDKAGGHRSRSAT